jgi:DNA modification methylase
MMELDTIFCGDALDVLRTLPDNFVHCCITSPPYYALRDYGVDGQIGREDTPAQYVARLTEVFSEVWRVLRPNGTLWLNIADTYCGTGSKGDHLDPKNPSGRNGQCVSLAQRVENVKAKDMIGIPWMLAFALRDYGWYLRSDIIWQKANPMPESCKDRPSRCYEHIFLMAKSRKYYFNAEAIAEPVAESTPMRMRRKFGKNKYSAGIPGQTHQHLNDYRPNGYAEEDIPLLRNKRDVWQINSVPYKGAHFAAYPPKLVETCLLAGCPQDGIVLDPFLGSGTTAAVAKQMGRHYIGIELNPDYCALAEQRIGGVTE